MISPDVLRPLVERVRTGVTARKNADGVQAWTREPLTAARISAHLNGGTARGVCPIKEGESTTRVALFDLDSHKGETSWEDMIDVAAKLMAALEKQKLRAIPFSSSGGKGIHLYLLWDAPQDAYSVRRTLIDTLESIGFDSGVKGVSKGEIEVFPKQNSVPVGGFGNQFILPLAGKSMPLDKSTLACLPRTREIDWDLSKPVLIHTKPEIPEYVDAPIVGLEEVQAALDAIPNTGENELDYDEWRNIIFALHQATHGSDDGLHLAHRFSERSSKYDPEFLDNRVWPYVTDKEGGVTVRTLFALARKHGWATQPSPDDFDVITEEVESATKPPTHNKFDFQPASKFVTGKPPLWIIKGILPKAEIGVLYGASGSGKTFFALDLLCAVARGEGEWQGRKVLPGACAYIAAEGAGGVKTRFKAYSKKKLRGLQHLKMHVLGDAPNFTDPKEFKLLCRAIRRLGPLAVIVVDTYAAVMPGGDENSGEDAGTVIAHCKLLHKLTGALVLLIHHSGKDASKGARGWSGLRAAVDVEIEVSKEEGTPNRWARMTKLKDGSDEDVEWGFVLKPVNLYIDEDGDQVTSCVVAYDELMVHTAPGGKNKKPRAEVDKQAIETLEGLLEETGSVLTNNLRNALINVLELKGLDAGQAEVERLISRGFITEKEGYCTRPDLSTEAA